MNRLSTRDLLTMACGFALLFGPRHNGYSASVMALLVLVLIAPAPGPSLGRAWRYACDCHPVLVSLVGVVLALIAATFAWVVLAGPVLLLVAEVVA